MCVVCERGGVVASLGPVNGVELAAIAIGNLVLSAISGLIVYARMRQALHAERLFRERQATAALNATLTALYLQTRSVGIDLERLCRILSGDTDVARRADQITLLVTHMGETPPRPPLVVTD